MRISAKIYRLTFCSVMLFSSIAAAGGKSIDDVAKEFSVIYYKLSKLASPSVSSMSVDSARMLLAQVQKRISGVHTIMRINSAGMIINEISLAGEMIPMRSVADQKWFVEVKENNRSYYGTSRQSGDMNPLLFWAWPILTGSGVFGGVLAVKLDAGPVCSSLCENDSVHFAVFYNENLLFRCGNDRYTFTQEAIWALPDSSRIILRSGDASVALQNREFQNEEKPIDDSAVESDGFYSGAKDGSRKNDIQKIQPRPDEKEKKGLNSLIYIVLCGVIISGILLVRTVLGKNTVVPKQYPEKTENCDNQENSESTDNSESAYRPDSDMVAPVQMDVTTDNVNVETDEKDALPEEKKNDETEHHLARETCEKIKSIISGNVVSDALSAPPSSASSIDKAVRWELYKEIHGQIVHWVTYESSRLSQSLQELSDRVGELENVKDTEVMRIRNEAQRISKEIASFKDNAAEQIQSEGSQV